MRSSSFRALYASLLLARLLAALLSPAYIHPDEYFQYGEVLVGEWFGKDHGTLTTWEFDPTFPCRSMASIKLFGWPLYLLANASRWLGKAPSAARILQTQRATFFALSLALDWSLVQLMSGHLKLTRQRALMLLACSAPVLTIGVRPFSNNVEAALLALCLSWTIKLHHRPSTISGLLLGGAMAMGLFSRFTFAIFALPLGMHCLAACLTEGRAHLQSLVSAANGFCIVSAVHIAYDTFYFASKNGDVPTDMSNLVIAPFNAAVYNLKSSNLADHGLHPRWLHAIVNAPMILGVGPYLLCVLAGWHFLRGRIATHGQIKDSKSKAASSALVPRLSLMTIFVSIALLSIQPHQEPRFLMPLIVPTCIVAACSLSDMLSRTLIRALATLTAIGYLGLFLLFGIAHQGGTIPAITDFEASLCGNSTRTYSATDIELYFWRSFMPPRHLLVPSRNSACSQYNITVIDMGSTPAIDVELTLYRHINGVDSRQRPVRFLFAPEWAFSLLESKCSSLLRESIIFPHVDMDHLGESIALVTQQGANLRQAFSYGVWRLRN